LAKASSFSYRNDFYVFGFTKETGAAEFIIYKINNNLGTADSLVIKNTTSDVKTQLQTSADSLHNFVNIYLYRNDKKVTIMRFAKSFKDFRKIENVEAARLNNREMFGEAISYFKDRVYSISTQKDSTGVQFYLNCYSLISPDKNFDYHKKWQFPFERKNILTARIIETTESFVAVFVNVIVAGNNTQWILRINSATGELIKGTRLNAKEEHSFYQYGCSFTDASNKNIVVAGIKHPAAALTPRAPVTNTNITVFLMLTDSFGQVIHKQNFQVPVRHTETGSVKVKTDYILKPFSLGKLKDGKIIMHADVYHSGNYRCYYYCSSNVFEFIPGEDGYLLKKSETGNLPQLENYYYSPDKNDLNGRICPPAGENREFVFSADPVLPVKLKFKVDENGLPVWLLTKSNTTKKTINYSILAIEGKSFKLKLIEEIEKKKDPAIIIQGSNNFITGSQSGELEYTVKIYSW